MSARGFVVVLNLPRADIVHSWYCPRIPNTGSNLCLNVRASHGTLWYQCSRAFMADRRSRGFLNLSKLDNVLVPP